MSDADENCKEQIEMHKINHYRWKIKLSNWTYKSASSLHPNILPLLIGEINKNLSLEFKP